MKVMGQIEVLEETENGGGWSFDAQVLDDDGTLRRHELRLSWADYNLWSPTGSQPPADVAAAVLRFLISRRPPAEIPESFDASHCRRWFADADEAIPGYL
jgi:hypothetical protein